MLINVTKINITLKNFNDSRLVKSALKVKKENIVPDNILIIGVALIDV